MNIKYASPSCNRAKGLKTLNYLSRIKMYISAKDYPAYCEHNPDHIDQFVVVPDGVQHRGKGICMNWMLDNLWDDQTDGIIVLDDDVTCMMKRHKTSKDEPVPEDEFYELCENWILLAKEWGVGLLSIGVTSDPKGYDEFAPFRQHAYMDGAFTGWVRNDGIRYSEDLSVKEDVDFALKQWQKYHRCLRIEKFYLRKDAFGDNTGGANDLRSSEVEKEQFKIMQQKWGADVIRPNRVSAKNASKIRGLGGAIRLNLPLKGV